MTMSPIRVIPQPKANNVWYAYTGSDTVLIFLLGIFSDSRGCWLYSEPSKPSRPFFRKRPPPLPARVIYWLNLIVEDQNFSLVDVFLAGFATDIDAPDFVLALGASEVCE